MIYEPTNNGWMTEYFKLSTFALIVKTFLNKESKYQNENELTEIMNKFYDSFE